MQELKQTLQNLQNIAQKRELPLSKHDQKHIHIQDKKLLNLASNDYLAIAQKGEIQREFFDTIDKNMLPSLSASSSRSMSANYEIFVEFEEFLQKLYGKSSLLFNSGYHLNVGAISALARLKGTLFLIDRQAHASMYDGLRLSNANFKRFRHNDLNHLCVLLEQNSKKFNRIIILSEALFSMDGDYIDLASLIQLKKSYDNVWLYIDEAHSVGASMQSGLGVVKDSDFIGDVDFTILTFGKALASVGGAIICDEIFKEYFINFSRSLIYSTALPPLNVAYTHFVFKHILSMHKDRERLSLVASWLKQNLAQKGLKVLGDSYIISVLAGTNEAALSLASKLRQSGYHVPAIRPPTIAPSSSRIRISLSANIQKEELKGLMDAL